MLSSMKLNVFSNGDIVLQIAQCSFDVHLEEILGTLTTLGTTVVFLHPLGTFDIKYMITTIKEKQVSFIGCVPTHLGNIWNYFKEHPELNMKESFVTMKTVVVGGNCDC